MRVHPLMTKDPIGGEPLVVTRLESPASGIVIEGAFSLGWIGRLTPEQLEFVGLLLRNRANVQKVAADLGISYNTARSRLDEIVTALGVPAQDDDKPSRAEVLEQLDAGEITFDDAMSLLRSWSGEQRD